MTRSVLRHSAQLCGLAENPALPATLLDRFVAMADEELSTDLADRVDLSPAQARILAGRDADTVGMLLEHGSVDPARVPTGDPLVGLRVAAHWPDRKLVRTLAGHPDPAIRAALPEWVADLPSDIVELLARDPSVDVVAQLAIYQPLGTGLADVLSRHPSAAVRVSLSHNRSVPADVLARLSAEANHDIDSGLARNPATPVAVLVDLARRGDWTRMAVAERIDLPPEALELLARDRIPGVRHAVASNAGTGDAMLRGLAATDDRDLRRAIAHNPGVPLNLLLGLARTSRIGPAAVPRIGTATDAELRALATSPVMQVRMLVAERPDLPPDLIAQLADDPDPGVVKGVVPRSEVAEEMLWTLADRHGTRLFPRMARNPNCSPALLGQLARNASAARKALREIARHPNADAETLLLCLADHDARERAARHPNLPVDTIVALLDDPATALPAAANPSLPVAVMDRLLG